MDGLKIINANFEAEDNSFLYYLHEENEFNEEAFSQLCECISSLCHSRSEAVTSQIVFIYGQVLEHIIYHFDPDDLSRISNLPPNYYEKLEILDRSISRYFLVHS